MPHLLELFCCCGSQSDVAYRPIRSTLLDWRNHPLVQQHRLLTLLGEGGFSEVWLAENKISEQKVAIKAVYLSKPGITREQVHILESEAKYLMMLGEHPAIIKCYQAIETRHDLVMILEYLSGGELLEHMHQIHHFDEAQAAAIFRQVVEGLAYMHDLNIMHRDLKPENVMFIKPVSWYQKNNKPVAVKLIDLGMAGVYKETDRMHGVFGSPGFMAPEVVRGGHHSLKMDIYGLGALLFVMLTGRKPFDLREIHSLDYANKLILEAPGIHDPSFMKVSPAARELLLSMLHDDPQQRPTARQVARHPWVVGDNVGPPRLVMDDVVRRRMMQLANLRRHKGLAFALMMGRDEVAASSTTNGQDGHPHHKGHQRSDLSTVSVSSRSYSKATRDAVLTSIRCQRKLMHAEIRGRERARSRAAREREQQTQAEAAAKAAGLEGRARRVSADGQRPSLDTIASGISSTSRTATTGARTCSRRTTFEMPEATRPGTQCSESSSARAPGLSVDGKHGDLDVVVEAPWPDGPTSCDSAHASNQPLLSVHGEPSDHPVHMLRSRAVGSDRRLDSEDVGAPHKVPSVLHVQGGIGKALGAQRAAQAQGFQPASVVADEHAAASSSVAGAVHPARVSSRHGLQHGPHGQHHVHTTHHHHHHHHQDRDEHGPKHKHRASGIDLEMVAAAVSNAPELQRAWSAPDRGRIPSILENAMGAAAPRADDMGMQYGSMDTGQLCVRATSLNPLALAFLENEAFLQEMLGEEAFSRLKRDGMLDRLSSTETGMEAASSLLTYGLSRGESLGLPASPGLKGLVQLAQSYGTPPSDAPHMAAYRMGSHGADSGAEPSSSAGGAHASFAARMLITSPSAQRLAAAATAAAAAAMATAASGTGRSPINISPTGMPVLHGSQSLKFLATLAEQHRRTSGRGANNTGRPSIDSDECQAPGTPTHSTAGVNPLQVQHAPSGRAAASQQELVGAHACPAAVAEDAGNATTLTTINDGWGIVPMADGRTDSTGAADWLAGNLLRSNSSALALNLHTSMHAATQMSPSPAAMEAAGRALLHVPSTQALPAWGGCASHDSLPLLLTGVADAAAPASASAGAQPAHRVSHDGISAGLFGMAPCSSLPDGVTLPSASPSITHQVLQLLRADSMARSGSDGSTGGAVSTDTSGHGHGSSSTHLQPNSASIRPGAQHALPLRRLSSKPAITTPAAQGPSLERISEGVSWFFNNPMFDHELQEQAEASVDASINPGSAAIVAGAAAVLGGLVGGGPTGAPALAQIGFRHARPINIPDPCHRPAATSPFEALAQGSAAHDGSANSGTALAHGSSGNLVCFALGVQPAAARSSGWQTGMLRAGSSTLALVGGAGSSGRREPPARLSSGGFVPMFDLSVHGDNQYTTALAAASMAQQQALLRQELMRPASVGMDGVTTMNGPAGQGGGEDEVSGREVSFRLQPSTNHAGKSALVRGGTQDAEVQCEPMTPRISGPGTSPGGPLAPPTGGSEAPSAGHTAATRAPGSTTAVASLGIESSPVGSYGRVPMLGFDIDLQQPQLRR